MFILHENVAVTLIKIKPRQNINATMKDLISIMFQVANFQDTKMLQT